MASISEFLSGFSYHGEPVIQSGAIDPNRKRTGLDEIGAVGKHRDERAYFKELEAKVKSGEMTEEEMAQHKEWWNKQYGLNRGQLRLDPNDFVFGGPEIFARLLQNAELDGGYLSDVSQNQQFAGETAGIMGLMGGANRERGRAAEQANLNPLFAQRQNIDAEFSTLSQILGRRQALGAELEERKFGAEQAFANMLAETVTSEKQFKVNTQAALAGADIGAQGAIAGGKAAASGSKLGGALAGIGSAIGGLAIAGVI